MAKKTSTTKKKSTAKIKKLNVEDLNKAMKAGADSSEIACKKDPKLTGCFVDTTMFE